MIKVERFEGGKLGRDSRERRKEEPAQVGNSRMKLYPEEALYFLMNGIE